MASPRKIAPGPGFAGPDSLSGLVGWYDASDESTITDTAGAVSQWDDKSGEGNHLDNVEGGGPTTGTRTIGGLNALDMGSSSTSIWIEEADVSEVVMDRTVFSVALADGAGGMGLLYSNDADAGRINLGHRGSGYGSSWCNTFNGTNYSFSGTYVAGDVDVMYLVAEGTTDTGQLGYEGDSGSGTKAIPTGGTLTDMDGFKIGEARAALPWDGAVGEVLIYNRELDEDELNAVGGYLADKWGITWTDVSLTY